MKVGLVPNSSAVDADTVFNVKETELQDWVFTRGITTLTTVLHVLQTIILSGLQSCNTKYSMCVFLFKEFLWVSVHRPLHGQRYMFPCFTKVPFVVKLDSLLALSLSLFIMWTGLQWSNESCDSTYLKTRFLLHYQMYK